MKKTQKNTKQNIPHPKKTDKKHPTKRWYTKKKKSNKHTHAQNTHTHTETRTKRTKAELKEKELFVLHEEREVYKENGVGKI